MRTHPSLAALCLLLIQGWIPCTGAEFTPAENRQVETYRGVARWRGTVQAVRSNSRDYHDVLHEVRSEEFSASATFTMEGGPYGKWSSTEGRVAGSYRSDGLSFDHFRWGKDSGRGDYQGEMIPDCITLDISRKQDKARRLEWRVSSQGRLTTKYAINRTLQTRNQGTTENSSSEELRDYWPHFAFGSPVQDPKGRPDMVVLSHEYLYLNPKSEKARLTDSVRVKIILVPEDSEYDLVVEAADYGTWLPKGNAKGGGKGNSLRLSAELLRKDGAKVAAPPSKVVFKLQDTSREPGVCMNWPRLAAKAADTPREDKDFDLRFAAGAGTLAGADAQELEVSKVEGTQAGGFRATAELDCHDYGAYGDLVVSAELPDGRKVYGHLKETDQFLIPVPRRRAGSKVAEIYRERWKCDEPDMQDNDALPVGDGNPGDGFSVYEEYRGFLTGGHHLRTKPEKKDLFLANKLGARALRGIDFFEGVTGLSVHEETLEAEMTVDHVANANRSDRSPRRSKEFQHGLLLALRVEKDGISRSQFRDIEKAWRPWNVEKVVISSTLLDNSRSEDADRELTSTITHELSHACGIRHHGNNDPRWRGFVRYRAANGSNVILDCPAHVNPDTGDFELDRGRNGMIYGSQVRVILEGSGMLSADAPQMDGTWFVYVGVAHGEHSGNTDCVMRYSVADCYIPEASPNDRVVFFDKQPIGLDHCPSVSADGVWKDRFGDGASGDCRHGFAVRDDAPDLKAR